MRIVVVVLLLVANVAFFFYALLDNASRGESGRIEQQIQPDKIKLMTPPQVAALGPAKRAALTDVWIEWGPFFDAERRSSNLRAEGTAGISALDAGGGQFAVSLGMFRTEPAARARADALSRSG